MLAAVMCACGDDAPKTTEPLCEAAAITSALHGSHAGDVVRVGACEVTGTFSVPPGVTLSGEGGASRLVAPAGHNAVILHTGGGTTVLSDLAVHADGATGVVAAGDGSARIAHVTVELVTGAGIGATGLAALGLEDVTVDGPIDGEPEASALPSEVAFPAQPTHGVAIEDVGDVQIAMLHVSGLAQTGVLLAESATTWHGGDVTEVRGSLVIVSGGSATLDGLELSHARQGIALIPPYGLVIAAGAAVETTGLHVHDNDRFGILQSEAMAMHGDLVAEQNHDAGIWVQGSPATTISGSATVLTSNAFAGIVAHDSSNVSISDARIDGTMMAMRSFMGETRVTVNAGDGVHLVDSLAGVALHNLRLLGNARVGVLIDGGGMAIGPEICDGVQVDGTGTQLGAIAQNGMLDPAWDTGVTRLGATAVNDPAFTGTLDPAGVVSPSDLPNTDAVGVVSPSD